MRRRFLTPNFDDLAIWRDLADAIDYVLKDSVDNPIRLMSLLRDTYNYRFADLGEELPSGLFDVNDLYPFPKEEYILVNNLLGFSITNSLLAREDYQNLSSTLGTYYGQKGYENFMDFFGYNTGSIFTIKPLWTQNYTSFETEVFSASDLTVLDISGVYTPVTPVYKGGTWYPTPNVELTVDFLNFGIYDPADVVKFFYYIAPLNLVLRRLVLESDVQITQMNMSMSGVYEIHIL